eukprot:2608783-Pyramimonas_sp.AAC.1
MRESNTEDFRARSRASHEHISAATGRGDDGLGGRERRGRRDGDAKREERRDERIGLVTARGRVGRGEGMAKGGLLTLPDNAHASAITTTFPAAVDVAAARGAMFGGAGQGRRGVRGWVDR